MVTFYTQQLLGVAKFTTCLFLHVSAQSEVDGDFEKFEEVGDEFFSNLTDECIEDLKLLNGIKQGWCFVY